MPKQLHELKAFQSGTITTPSERDVPEDAASYSKNIDSVTEDGKLKSIPDDTLTIVNSAATGWVDIRTQPANNDTLLLNGVTIRFVDS